MGRQRQPHLLWSIAPDTLCIITLEDNVNKACQCQQYHLHYTAPFIKINKFFPRRVKKLLLWVFAVTGPTGDYALSEREGSVWLCLFSLPFAAGAA